MKKLIALLFCIILAGCSSGNSSEGPEKEVYPVVERYLESSAAGRWQEVFDTLSGEALTEAKANSGRVKAQEKVVRKSLALTSVCDGVKEVAADFTVGAGGGFDRLAYRFRLKKTGDKWLIYKTEYGEYIHGPLGPGQLPPGAAEAISSYVAMPFKDKHRDGEKYLAGKLLQETKRAALMPVDPGSAKEQEKVSARVRTMECLGLADGYAVVRVSYDITKDNKAYPAEMLIDALEVNGVWKICRLDVL